MTDWFDLVRTPLFLVPAALVLVGCAVALRIFQPTRKRTAPASAPPLPGEHGPAEVAEHEPVALPTRTGVRFADIAGLDGAIAELREVVEYLTDQARFDAVGALPPRGILLYGPPGCGKTLLARAVADEAGVPSYFVSATGFVEKFVGLGAARVRQLFEKAKRHAPSIVFIDELDAVGRRRSAEVQGEREFDNTLNQLLVELDGFLGASGVLILAATNRPELIDPALLRPGRFDRRIEVDRPDRAGREQVLALHASRRPFARGVDWAYIADHTAGLSAAELANIVNEASLLAARRKHLRISPEDVDDALARVLSGMRSSRLMTDEEKCLVAHHEAGHALLSSLLRGIRPPARVSIVGQVTVFGRSAWSPPDDRTILTKRELLAHLMVLLGGRAAEINVFGEPSTRAEDDLEHAAALARRMVERSAMTGRFELASPQLERMGQPGGAAEDEIRKLVASAEQAARTILRDNSERLRTLADLLTEKETLTAAEIAAVVGSPPALDRVQRALALTRAGTAPRG
ncbi:MAG: ATP-dependent metallopeptidase FtsH/Yme1/Tma family protein [Actinomycetota bacterium]